VCKVILSKCIPRGVTAWVPTHAPILWVIHPRNSLPSSRAMHADRLLGHDPLMGRLCPSGFPTVVRTCRVPTPYARIPCELSFFFLVLEVWLENHISLPTIIVWGTEARGLHAPTVPPPSRSLLPVGIVRGHASGIGTFLVLNLVNARGRSTPLLAS